MTNQTAESHITLLESLIGVNIFAAMTALHAAGVQMNGWQEEVVRGLSADFPDQMAATTNWWGFAGDICFGNRVHQTELLGHPTFRVNRGGIPDSENNRIFGRYQGAATELEIAKTATRFIEVELSPGSSEQRPMLVLLSPESPVVAIDGGDNDLITLDHYDQAGEGCDNNTVQLISEYLGSERVLTLATEDCLGLASAINQTAFHLVSNFVGQQAENPGFSCHCHFE